MKSLQASPYSDTYASVVPSNDPPAPPQPPALPPLPALEQWEPSQHDIHSILDACISSLESCISTSSDATPDTKLQLDKLVTTARRRLSSATSSNSSASSSSSASPTCCSQSDGGSLEEETPLSTRLLQAETQYLDGSIIPATISLVSMLVCYYRHHDGLSSSSSSSSNISASSTPTSDSADATAPSNIDPNTMTIGRALFLLGLLWKDGITYRMRDWNRTFELFVLASFSQCALALQYVGVCQSSGRGVRENKHLALVNYRRSFEHIERAARDQADWLAQFLLASRFEFEYGCKQDMDAAAHWYHLAASRGYAPAANNLGAYYQRRRDAIEAMKWYRVAAEKGHALAQSNLASMYDSANGANLVRNVHEARRWYEKAAIGGSTLALNNLGCMYDLGDGVEVNAAEARRLYMLAAEQESAVAQYNLGVMYARNDRDPGDAAMAVEWYRKAAANGHATASYNLGVCYVNGTGVEPDLEKARQCFQQSANQKHIKAIVALAKQYERGLGVPVNIARAVRWYDAASALNCEESTRKLAELYSELQVPWDATNHHRFPANAKEVIETLVALTTPAADHQVVLVNPSLPLLPFEMVTLLINHVLAALRQGGFRASDPAPPPSSSPATNHHFRRFYL